MPACVPDDVYPRINKSPLGLVASLAIEVKGMKVVGKLAEKAGFVNNNTVTVQRNFKLDVIFLLTQISLLQIWSGKDDFYLLFISALVNKIKQNI